MRKVQWSTLVSKREKLSRQVESLEGKKSELDALDEQIAALITPEAIEAQKAKVVKLRGDLARAEDTLTSMLSESSEERSEPVAEAATSDETEGQTAEVEIE